MSVIRRGVAALGLAALLVLTSVVSAFAADDTFQECLDRSLEHNGQPPTCTEVDGKWVASWPDEGGSGGGVAVLMLLVLALGVAVLVWKVRTARALATEAGMDPGVATQMTLLTDHGLETTYLAANLRPTPGPSAPAPPTRPKVTSTTITIHAYAPLRRRAWSAVR